MWRAKDVRFASDHPTAPGHFPGNPIIPGALLLDEAVSLITEGSDGHAVIVRAAKFYHPVRPGDAMVVRWHEPRPGSIKFECRLAGDDRLVASGTIETGLLGQ